MIKPLLHNKSQDILGNSKENEKRRLLKYNFSRKNTKLNTLILPKCPLKFS